MHSTHPPTVHSAIIIIIILILVIIIIIIIIIIIVAHAFTRIQTVHRMNTVTENNKMTNTGMNIK